jgi:hypothetical protein
MRMNDKVLQEKIRSIYIDIISKFAKELEIRQLKLEIKYPKCDKKSKAFYVGSCNCDFILNPKSIIIGVEPKCLRIFPKAIKQLLEVYGINVTQKVFLTMATFVLIHETFHVYQYNYEYKKFIGKHISDINENSEFMQKIEKETENYCYKYNDKRYNNKLMKKINKFYYYAAQCHHKLKSENISEKQIKIMTSLVNQINKLSAL